MRNERKEGETLRDKNSTDGERKRDAGTSLSNEAAEKPCRSESLVERLLENPKLKLTDEFKQKLRSQARTGEEACRCPSVLVEIEPQVIEQGDAEDLPVVLRECEKDRPIPTMGYVAELEPTMSELQGVLECSHVRSVEAAGEWELW
jgi:hypothetical protein